MSTRKAILGSIGAIFSLIISQLISQLIGSGLIFIFELPEWIGTAVAAILYIIIAYFLLKLLVEKILKLKLVDVNIPKPKFSLKWILIGFALPTAVTCIYFMFPGTLVYNKASLLSTFSIGVLYTGLAAAFVEEMVFRGVVFSLLEKRWDSKVAIIVPSLLFGIVHVLGMGYSVGSILLVVVAGTMVGVMFSIVMLDTRSIWNSGIVHMLWNVIIIGGFICISHAPSDNTHYNYILKSNSFALTGGEFGIESSVIALGGYILVTAIALFMMQKRKLK